MLAAISRQRVDAYQGEQDPIIYLVSTVQRVMDAGLTWCFTDGHALERVTSFLRDISDMDRVDWAVIAARQWRNTDDDPDRMRRKQAEFLVHKSVPWQVFLGVAVRNVNLKQRVEELLASVDPGLHRPVAIRPKWYYD